jgi:hypothetical protein
MSITYLYPNGDVSTEWSRSTGSTNYTLIDETSSSSFRSPNPADTSDYVYSPAGGGFTDVYDMSTASFAVGNVSGIVVWFYIGDDGNGGEIDISPEIYVKGAWNNDNGNASILTFGTTGDWVNYSFNGNWNQNDIDSLKVKLNCTYCDFDTKCFGTYAEIIYNGPSNPTTVRDCFQRYTVVASGTTFSDVDGIWTFDQKDSSNNSSTTSPTWYSGDATATHKNIIYNVSGVWNLNFAVVGGTKDIVFKNYLGSSAPMPTLSGWTYSSSYNDNAAAETAEGHGIGAGWSITLAPSNGPITASGMLSWHRAHDISHINTNNSRVIYWYEASGRVKDFYQNSDTNRPTYATSALNSLPTIRTTNGSGNWFVNDVNITDVRSLYVVMKHDTGSSADYQFFLGGVSNFDLHGKPGNLLFDTGFSNAALNAGSVYVNTVSTAVASVAKPSGTYKLYSILTNGNPISFSTVSRDRNLTNRSWDGNFAEIIAYSGVHGSTDRSVVEDYLINKYSLLPIDSLSGSIPLYMRGLDEYNSSLPLFMSGPISNSGNLDLYISGPVPQSSGLNLYISGPMPSSGNLDLFLSVSTPNSGNLPLYLPGPFVSTSGLNLYLLGPIPQTNHINLYLQTDSPQSGTSLLNLSLVASHSGASYTFSNTNLFLTGDPLSSNMNLYVLGGAGPRTSGISDLNLYLQCDIPSKNNSLDLIINPVTDFSNKYSESGLSLYIEGDGLFENYVPSNSYMNLYMNTGRESISGISLYTNAYGTGNSVIPMYIFGVSGYLSQGLQLFMPTKDFSSGTLSLFVRGFRGS